MGKTTNQVSRSAIDSRASATVPLQTDHATFERTDAREQAPAAGRLRIELLGHFRLETATRSIAQGDWRLKKAALVVKLLALAPQHRLHREQLIDVLWPGATPQAAANNLHHALHVARGVLGVPGALRLQNELVTLLPADHVWTDVAAFHEAASSARRTQTVAAYRAALALYRGELLPGDLYEESFEALRTSLRNLRISLLLELSALYEAGSQFVEGIDALQQVLEAEPASEEAHVRLMRFYARSGRRHQALRQYSQLLAALREEMDMEPAADTQLLYRDILEGRSPTPVSPAVTPRTGEGQHNLQETMTSFIGRESQIAEVKQLLGMSRLVTIVGPGGAGKTRLALEVARMLVDEYRDGVYLIELASAVDQELVPETVRTTLGIPEVPGQPARATLLEGLAGKHRLLVLDNCEHLIGACAALAHDLLRSCPQLRVLATSREALGTLGEVTEILSSLSLPPEDEASVNALLSSESVRLFVDRARFRQPKFELTQDNGQMIAAICRRIDGMPLAIELAAARVGVLSVGQIAARLEDALSLLTAGLRTDEPRHQTLRGAIDWSYQLLDENERSLFARLAVFVGGWTLSAAEALGERDQDVLDVLSRLVDKSLVTTEHSVDDEIRYRMLEPIRQYALERLEMCDNVVDVRDRHAALFLTLAEEAEPQLIKSDQARWMERLHAEHDNLQAALQWLRRTGRPETAMRLAGALWRFWYTRGYLREGRAWLRVLLEECNRRDVPPEIWVKALGAAAALAYYQSDFDTAGQYWEQCASTCRARGDKRGLARYLGNLGLVFKERGEYERAMTLYEESRAISVELGNLRGVSSALGNLGIIAIDQQDYDRARELQEESLVLKRKLHDDGGIATSLNNLAAIAVEQGDYQRAQALSEEGLVLAKRLGLKRSIFVALVNLGFSALHRGQLVEAARLFAESLTLSRNNGETVGIRHSLAAFAALGAARGQGEAAAQLAAASDSVREAGQIVLSPAEQATHQRTVTIARNLLGEEAFKTASAVGRRMTTDEAVAYALGLSDYEMVRRPSAPLTERQMQIAALVALGHTNVQIARQLGISERTITTHVSNILSRLGFASRTQLAAWVAEGN